MRRRKGEEGNNKIAIYSLHQDSRIRIFGAEIYIMKGVDRERILKKKI